MTALEAARELGIQLSGLYPHLKSGRLRATKMQARRKGSAHGLWHIDEKDFRAFAAQPRQRGAHRKVRPPRVIVQPRMTPEQQLDILAARAKGLTMKECAARIGLSEAAVSRFLSRWFDRKVKARAQRIYDANEGNLPFADCIEDAVIDQSLEAADGRNP